MQRKEAAQISGVDLFCGAGGLSFGLQKAHISIAAGVDLDPACQFPIEANVGAKFIKADVRDLTADLLLPLWPDGAVRLLAGCAPCQPFSPYRRGQDTSKERDWPLLAEFARLASETEPTLITMENVPRIGRSAVFADFVSALERDGYYVSWESHRAADYGLPQTRRRLVLLASKLGPISMPKGRYQSGDYRTVRKTIAGLPPIEHGSADPSDPMHRSRRLSDTNLQRMQASTPGGSWEDWPEALRSNCHRKATGSTFRNVYSRMEWDKPAPTITTLAYNFGTGRFGHPEQDRAISLREAAMLQGFPRKYKFVQTPSEVTLDRVGRLIGNAVPPPLAKAVGATLAQHVDDHGVAP